MNWKRSSIIIGLLALASAQPQSLLACSACYGDPNSAMSVGLTWAITFLGGVIVCVLAGLTMFFVHANRKSGSEDAKADTDSNK